MSADERASSPTARPALRIVSGNPTPEELAALTVVLSSLGNGAKQKPAAPVRGGWADPVHGLRTPLRPGAGAWRSAGR